MGKDTASLVAFTLRDEYAGTIGEGDDERPIFQGGDLALGDESFNVAEALEQTDHRGDDGEPILVVDTATNTALADLLRSYPPLKGVPVPEGATAVKAYADQSMPALRAEAQRRRLAHIERRKSDLAARLEAHDRAIATGDDAAIEQIRAGDAEAPADDQAGDAGDTTDQEA